MEFSQLVKDVKKQFISVDISEIRENLAFQFNLEGENGGTFYIEVKDGILSVEPYEYIDRDALFTISVENFMKLITSKLDPVLAYTTGKLKVDGDVTKALQIKNLLKEEKKDAIVEEKKDVKANNKTTRGRKSSSK